MKVSVQPSTLNGTVAIPGSKSHTIRAVAIASLAEGQSRIHAPLMSADTLSAVKAYRALGATIDCDEVWTVQGVAGQPRTPDNIIDIGNSGTSLRFAIGSAALLHGGSAVFTGDYQIRSRQVGPLLSSLNDLGANCFSTRGNGAAPVVISGTMQGGATQIEAKTSQYVSSLLINTPLAHRDTAIKVTLLNEQPYVEITLRYLDAQGIEYRHENCRYFEIRGGQNYRGCDMTVAADFSSATFFLVAGAVLNADLLLTGLDMTDAQGDKAVVNMLRDMGAAIDIRDDGIAIRQSELHGIEIDMNATPDALPAMAVAGCFARGETRLVNVPQARMKETDRIAVMCSELKKMGADIEELPDGLIIRESQLKAAPVTGHDDHRIVMSLCVAGMGATGQTIIDTAEAVEITFPDFYKFMRQLGGQLELQT